MSIKIYHAVLGEIGTNCYVIVNESVKRCIIVDPADQPESVGVMVEKCGCEPAAVLLTHGHYDHMTAAEAIKDKYNINIYAGDHEKDVLLQPDKNLSGIMGRRQVSLKADRWLSDGDELELAGIKIKVLHTPGHTEGGVCYYIAEASALFSGDTLFAESVGRTDFPTGSMGALINSIKNKLLPLPEETVVYTGHGDTTTIGYEKQYNPYCQ